MADELACSFSKRARMMGKRGIQGFVDVGLFDRRILKGGKINRGFVCGRRGVGY